MKKQNNNGAHYITTWRCNRIQEQINNNSHKLIRDVRKRTVIGALTVGTCGLFTYTFNNIVFGMSVWFFGNLVMNSAKDFFESIDSLDKKRKFYVDSQHIIDDGIIFAQNNLFALQDFYKNTARKLVYNRPINIINIKSIAFSDLNKLRNLGLVHKSSYPKQYMKTI